MSVKRGFALSALTMILAPGCPTPKPVLPTSAGTSSTGALPSSSSGSTAGGEASTSVTDLSSSTSAGLDDSEGSSSTGGEAVCELDPARCEPSEDDWWDPAWAYRRPITVDSPLPGPMADAVIPLRLDGTFEFACLDPQADDLRFVDQEGNELAHEVDEWMPGVGAIVWVHLPVLDRPTNQIWMYYGNPRAPSATAQEVWPAQQGYQAVLHFGEDLDDARGSHHGEPAVPGDSFFADDGVLGHAIHFEEVLVDRRVELMSSDLIDNAIIASEAFTISAWIRPTPDVESGSQFKVVMGRGAELWALLVFDDIDGPDFLPPVGMLFHSRCDPIPSGCVAGLDFNNNHFLQGSVPVIQDPVLAVWHHVAIVYESLKGGEHRKRLFVDGQLDLEFTGLLPLAWTTLALHISPVTVGAGPEGDASSMFHGEIDEFHLASAAWDSDRILAEFEFTRDLGESNLVRAMPAECR